MIKLYPYREGDIHQITEPRDCFSVDPNLYYRMEQLCMAPTSMAHTIRTDDGEALAVFGLHKYWEGVGEVYGVISKLSSLCPIPFARLARVTLNHYMKEHRMHRVQAWVRYGFDDERRFAKLLGFEIEGLMRKFGPEKDDYYMCARVK